MLILVFIFIRVGSQHVYVFTVRLVVEHVRPGHERLAALVPYEERPGRRQAGGLHVRLQRVRAGRKVARVRDAKAVHDILLKVLSHARRVLGDVLEQVGALERL